MSVRSADTATLEYRSELARPWDDPALARLMAANQVPGWVVLTHERSPSYLADCQVMGRRVQPALVRHQASGEVVAMGVRALSPRFVNGHPEEVGYLGDLRTDPRSRGPWLAARLFGLLRELHADGQVGGYLGVLAEHNLPARRLLVGRASKHFPTFREVGRLCTLALVLRKRQVVRAPCELRRATSADLDAIVGHLGRAGAARQFFPRYSVEDFLPGSRTTRGFDLGDLFIASSRGKVLGVAGLWDRSASRQTVVQAYQGPGRWARLGYDLGARLIGAQPLPAPGRRLPCAYASFICVVDDALDVHQALLRSVCNLAVERGHAFLMLGAFAGDPLLSIARRYLHLPYHSRLYTACYPGEERFHERLDGRTPYVELAAL